MHVTNREPCTLIIGETQIPYGETRPVAAEWEARCEHLATKGALFVHRGGKPDDRPSRIMSPAEIFAAMSPAEQRAAIAQVRASEAQSVPEHVILPMAATIDELADDPNAVAAHNTAVRAAHAANLVAIPEGAPLDFHTGHHNKALAFVRKCNDAALLTALGNSESRESVLSAIIDRVQALETKSN